MLRPNRATRRFDLDRSPHRVDTLCPLRGAVLRQNSRRATAASRPCQAQLPRIRLSADRRRVAFRRTRRSGGVGTGQRPPQGEQSAGAARRGAQWRRHRVRSDVHRRTSYCRWPPEGSATRLYADRDGSERRLPTGAAALGKGAQLCRFFGCTLCRRTGVGPLARNGPVASQDPEPLI